MPGRTPKNKQQGKAFDSEAALILYLKEVAQRRQMSNTAIAKVTGIDRRQIDRIMAGEKTPTIASFFKIADLLGIRMRVDTQNLDLIEMGFVPRNWVYPEPDIDAYFDSPDPLDIPDEE